MYYALSEPLTSYEERLRASPEYAAANAHAHVAKRGAAASTEHALSGELVGSSSGWVLLNVPNALVRGAFDALNEPGVELPPNSGGRLNAHISVMRPEEVERIGGMSKITERGHHFHYTLGPIQSASPSGWGEMSKVWFIQVKSKELQDLRKAYGLSPRPNDNEFDFHITIGVRRKRILHHNDVAKSAGLGGGNYDGLLEEKTAQEDRRDEAAGAGRVGGGGEAGRGQGWLRVGGEEVFGFTEEAFEKISSFYPDD